MMLTPLTIRALQYVVNTGGNATIAFFDEDHKPIGPSLRQQLMPTYLVENVAGKLELTEAGRSVLEPPAGRDRGGTVMAVQHWCEDVDPEEELWVCVSCDAHLHVDSVGEKCPICGEPAHDDHEAGRAALRVEGENG